MKKSELRQVIREEIRSLLEAKAKVGDTVKFGSYTGKIVDVKPIIIKWKGRPPGAVVRGLRPSGKPNKWIAYGV